MFNVCFKYEIKPIITNFILQYILILSIAVISKNPLSKPLTFIINVEPSIKPSQSKGDMAMLPPNQGNIKYVALEPG